MPARPQLVLLADDHADSRIVLRAILEFYGRSVLEAENGVECVRLAREGRPDLIVLDLRMPAMDGWTVAATLKRDPTTAHIPILAVTASAFAEDRDRALAAGCGRVLLKPVPPRELVAQCDELYARSISAPPIIPA